MTRGTLLTLVALAATVVFATVALAASAFDVQANQPQIAGDPTSNATARFPTNKQNEPTIAINPTNSNFLVAGANDEQLQPPCGPGPVRGSVPANDCAFFPGVGTDGVYTSSNGGASWTNRGLLPGFSDNGGSLQSDGDPRIVYGPQPDASGSFAGARAANAFVNGVRAYYGGLAEFAPGSQHGRQAPELLTVSTSDNNGVNWSDPVIAANGHGFLFNDKPDVWADRNPSSPFFGRLYVSWTQFRGSAFTFFGEPVRVVFSDDGGKTWSKERQLSAGQNIGHGGRQGSTVRTGPDGTVYVVWEDSDVNGFKQVVAVSHDGGVSFSRPIDIARVHDIQDPIPGANFRDNSFPSLAGRSGHGHRVRRLGRPPQRYGHGRRLQEQRPGAHVVDPDRRLPGRRRLRVLPGPRRGAERARRRRLPGGEGEGDRPDGVRKRERDDRQLLRAVDRRRDNLERLDKGELGLVRSGGVCAEQPGTPVLGRLQHPRLHERERVLHLHRQS
jgi:hypothetical protein